MSLHPLLTDQGQFLAPYVPRDMLMAGPWFAHLQFCLGREDIMQAFRAETGCQWQPGRTPLERMIDDATGAHREMLVQFAAWVNANLWGEVG